jgi:cytoskeletal protein RodZ
MYYQHATENLHQEEVLDKDVLLSEAALLVTIVLMLTAWVWFTYRSAAKSVDKEEHKEGEKKKQSLTSCF